MAEANEELAAEEERSLRALLIFEQKRGQMTEAQDNCATCQSRQLWNAYVAHKDSHGEEEARECAECEVLFWDWHGDIEAAIGPLGKSMLNVLRESR